MKRKKISIITILDVTNIGTYLQAYALGRTLQQLGVDVEYIRYTRPLSSWSNLAKSRWKQSGQGIRGLAAAVYGGVVDTWSIQKCRNDFTSRIAVSRRYRSFRELVEDPPQANVFLTGSDQVWNPIHNRGVDRAFFLDFGDEQKPRFAYAASLGTESVPDQYKKEMLSLLRKYSWIGMREFSGQQALQHMGLQQVTTVLDPTLLWGRERWAQEVNKPFGKREPYLLVYSVERDRRTLVSAVAGQVARQMKLPIYFVTPRWFSTKIKCDRAFYFATPSLFLSLFLNADYAVVSSFHGTALSVNFNIPFCSVAPPRFGARSRDLLKRVHLESRSVASIEEALTEFSQPFHWGPVNAALDKERKTSFDYLGQIIAAAG